MIIDKIDNKLTAGGSISFEEAIALYNEAPTAELCSLAHSRRVAIKGNDNIVTWQIDRNVNITNVCVSGCRFCNFHCKPHQRDRAFITTLDEYNRKIEETLSLGGDQLLLQGGMHPNINYYEQLFKELKNSFPTIKLHALGPPEVFYISKISGISINETLTRLIDAGLSSFPGAGAEILDDNIRNTISPAKCSASQWLEVMAEAHKLNLATSATMMYGHIEEPRHRIEHLFKLRNLQSTKPQNSYGFLAFIPWIFWSKGTQLEAKGVSTNLDMIEYLRLIAISRIVLDNIPNIQASWLTMGVETGQLSLHCGANDLGSIMIEENVVSSAGAGFRLNREEMEQIIKEAGFTPRLRDQKYNLR